MRSAVIALLPALIVALAALADLAAAKKSGYKMRLVDGPDKSKGRLEFYVQDTTGWIKPGWYPTCESSVDARDAKFYCQLMGYKRGRPFYSPAVSISKVEPPYPFIVDVWCSAPLWPAPARRQALGALSASASSTTAAASDAAASDETAGARKLRAAGAGGADGAAGAARRLLKLDEFGEFMPVGESMSRKQLPIATAKGRPSNCTVWFSRTCGRGAFLLAGLECSNKRFTGGQQMLPPLPSPPPPPPAKNAFLRLKPLESNLCYGGMCGPNPNPEYEFKRVELLVADPADVTNKVWAPLCGFDPNISSSFTRNVSMHVCRMWGNYPASLASTRAPTAGLIINFMYALPSGAIPSGGFDPSVVPAWASIAPPTTAASLYKPARLMQDNDGFTVSNAECEGGLFIVQCRTVIDV
ncbi:hypothetical protein HYH03_005376 [Edaphochlamys debaryana]|uniref:SRCR domain-containing protein n=1 Tax=Edaphochlamys debaryana TaxID=47281 RepID=A0A835Y867_9CHLO|nr:hypothetical protein HYH03_005376 [Edaphochlamys debaryana]|eukprot:KAG2496553.1 hypothetical protein HYH03_005376 [Edaphochlamys debaryana]